VWIQEGAGCGSRGRSRVGLCVGPGVVGPGVGPGVGPIDLGSQLAEHHGHKDDQGNSGLQEHRLDSVMKTQDIDMSNGRRHQVGNEDDRPKNEELSDVLRQ
jgi:hypothetical protein